MLLTDLYIAKKHPEVSSKWRYDVVQSTGSYDFFESLMLNKKNPNLGGLSYHFIDTPDNWNRHGARRSDKAFNLGLKCYHPPLKNATT